jgi:carboxymethylenebutenolidase
MKSSSVDVTTADGAADAYITRPEGDGPHPAVLFVMDALGLRPRIEQMADRIAAQGYVVLAPNVFYRAGRARALALPDFTDQRAAFMDAVRPLIDQLTPSAPRATAPATWTTWRVSRRVRSQSPATAWAAVSAGASPPRTPTA